MSDTLPDPPMAGLCCRASQGEDSENENQALTLYERHGFVSDRLATEWHRPLEVR